MVRQEVASAPVCDRAKSATSDRPTTSAAAGLRAVSWRTAATSAGPPGMDSTCIATARVRSSAARYCSTSGALTSTALPSPTASETPTPASASR